MLPPANGNNDDGDGTQDFDDDITVTDPAELIQPNKFRCEQMDAGVWRDFCSFFMLPQNGVDGTDPDQPIPFWGMRRHPRPYQLRCFLGDYARGWRRGWRLHWRRDGRGQDDGGNYIPCCHRLFFRDVQRSRCHSKLADRHLPADVSPNTPNLVCPSQSKFPILCSCVPGGITSRLEGAVRDGATLVVMPPSLLLVWMEEFKKTIADPQEGLIQIQLYACHGDMFSSCFKGLEKLNVALVSPSMLVH